VQFELQSAEDAARAGREFRGQPDIITIARREWTFERATGRAQTVQPVKFSFPNGAAMEWGRLSIEQGQLTADS